MSSSSLGLASASQSKEVVIICTLFTALAFLMVILRLVTRVAVLGKQGPDDWVCVVAMIGSIGLTTLTLEEVHFGLGKHITTLTPTEVKLNLKSLWGAIMVYYTTLGLVKISILIQYLRIFPSKPIRISCYVLIGLVSVYTIISTTLSAFSCVPVAFFWDTSIPGPHKCLSQLAFWFSNASFNILTDLAVLILPMPVIKSLRLGKQQKYALMGVFALGGFTVITSVLRLHSLYIISVSKDPTWDNVGAATWSSLEVNIGIICSSLPILRPLITKFFSRVLASDIRSSAPLASTTRQSAVNDSDLELQPNNAAISSSGLREKPPVNGIAVTTFYTIEHDSSKEDLEKSISASSSNGTLGRLPSRVL